VKKHILWMMWALTGMLALNGCSSGSSAASGTIPSLDGKKDSFVYLMAGRIDAGEKSDITSKISAKVTEINVDVGSSVKAGDPIVRLDSKDLEALVSQAEAVVNTAQANLAKLKSGARPEQILEAQAALDSAKTNFENLTSANERNKQLYDSGGISKSQMEQSQTALSNSEASYKSAKEALDILTKGETPETINVSESQLKQAQAALELAQTQFSNGTVLTPISGVVIAKNINVGELAAAGVPLITVVNQEDVFVDAYLPADLINKVKAGQEAIIKVSEIPGKVFDGEISVIDSVIDSKNKNILIKVKFKEEDPLLKPGMFAEIGLKS
jgi:HlyD family secretion protein